MDAIDQNWDKPFSALAGNDRLLVEGAPETLFGAFAETDICDEDDHIVFGIPYDFGFEITHDHLHDDLYDGILVRGPHLHAGQRLRKYLVNSYGQTVPFSANSESIDLEEVTLDLDKVSAHLRDYLIELLSSERYGLDREYLAEALEVGDMGADGNAIEISIGVRANTDTTVGEVYDKYVWPFFAALANCTDPGTFNHGYWASEVAAKLDAEALTA